MPRTARPRVVLSGFRPFGGGATNPSEALVRRIAAAPPDGIDLVPLVFPVEYGRGDEILRATLAARPHVVLHLGLAGNRETIDVERFALNWRGGPEADEAGVRIAGEEIEPGGPAACLSTLPVDLLVAAGSATGAPCRASAHAGTFLCNQTLYRSLRAAERSRTPFLAAFVHVPLPRADGSRPGDDAIERAVRAILAAAAARAPATRTPRGRRAPRAR